jgi:hypothetical protein
MTNISDDTPINELYIPATHNSLSYGSLFVLPDNQYLNFEEQLNAGVRVFDIRLSLENTTFIARHGIVKYNTKFDEIYSKAIKFLNENKGEFIIMFIKQEYTINTSFSNMFKLSYANNDSLVSTDINSPSDTISEFRGKIIYIYREDVTWKDNDIFNTSKFIIQDVYKTTYKNKIKKITELFNMYNTSQYVIVVNFLSYYDSYLIYYYNQNSIFNHLHSNINNCIPGIYMLDYVTNFQSGVLIQKNLKSELKLNDVCTIAENGMMQYVRSFLDNDIAGYIKIL